MSRTSEQPLRQRDKDTIHTIQCNAHPHLAPGTTDHFAIISVIDLLPPTVEPEDRRNWRATDWEEFNKILETELEADPMVAGYASEAEVLAGLTRLDSAINRCVEKLVPLCKPCSHSKRWWTKELTVQMKERNAHALKSFRKRDLPFHPIHEEYRRVRNNF
ncbi:hypothetical protein GGX14DRAFT_364782, partial [Mycena pura]